MSRSARSADFQSAVSPIFNRHGGQPPLVSQTPQTRSTAFRVFLSAIALGLATQPASLWACAACYGQSNSAMARGMNWGIFSLLAVVVTVLGGISTFFVYLARRSAAISATAGHPSPAASVQNRATSEQNAPHVTAP